MSDYKYQSGTLTKSFYYYTSNKTAIMGGLSEVEVRSLIHDFPEISVYVTDALQYWNENKYFENKHTSVFAFKTEDNLAIIFVRFDDSALRMYNQVSVAHISRFTVAKKSNGLGSEVLKWFQQFNKHITLWSNQDAIKFYEKNGFQFRFDQFTEVENHKYTFGSWTNKNV